jgi:hypothetical protein
MFDLASLIPLINAALDFSIIEKSLPERKDLSKRIRLKNEVEM